MRIHLSRTISGAVLTIILLAAPAFGSQRHHALNGTWTLVPTKSDFAGQAVFQTGTVTIDDRQGNITVARNFTYDGATETFFYNFSTDGRENATIQQGKDFKSKAKWEGDVLKVTTTQAGVTTLERYSLAADGTLLLKVEVAEHRPITLVLVQK
jgi:hypothetical protein